MPRLIPRLLRIISKQASLDKVYPFDIKPGRKRTKSLVKPCLPNPTFHPADYSRSILLSHTPSNPITRSRDYFRHKYLPPRVYIPRRAKVRSNEHDRPREMSEDEKCWRSNPYLRMLSSPIRRCMVTNRYLPSDFLVRLSPVKMLAGNSTTAVLVPDGLQHTKFTARRLGRAAYVLCCRDAFKYVEQRGQALVRGQKVHPNLVDYVAHLLRLRVLQEFELLAEQLEFSKEAPSDSQYALRRLTRSEWRSIKQTGVIPFHDPLAVIVLPPLNKDAADKQYPEPIMSTLPSSKDGELQDLVPSMSLLHLLEQDLHSVRHHSNLLPSYQVPLYHGLTLFPNKHQRAALHRSLLRILASERRSCQATRGSQDKARNGRARGDAKHSHAFLISSGRDIVRRADVSPTAIALWRVRMFEGGGMEDDGTWTNCSAVPV